MAGAKIHNSLVEPILLGGCPRTFAILNWTMTAAIGLGLQQWEFFLVGVFLHAGGAALAKKDPEFFDIILRHIKQKEYLE